MKFQSIVIANAKYNLNNTKDDAGTSSEVKHLTVFRGTRLGPNYNEQETQNSHTTKDHKMHNNIFINKCWSLT